ncbi:TMEM175 family protein [Krasilnikovia sp. MM14-A1259]|uniref:TMEM175 family protein n=1 Tax=Krasilnikovia sp. MM14-A1259 TaxID=3373539 RepID=UPI0037FF6FA1
MTETVAERAQSDSAVPVSPERLIYFSDAVIAIAITLLALELPVPTGSVHGNHGVLEFLREHSAEYLAFLISFTAVAMQWMAHHRLFRYATGLVGGVIQANLVWLLMIVVMPFTTKMLTSEADGFQVQFSMYAADQALAALCLVLAFTALRRRGLLRANTPPGAITETLDWMTTVIVVFTISIPIAFMTHWASLSWIFLPVVRSAIRFARRAASTA